MKLHQTFKTWVFPDVMSYLKCIVFIRPTKENLEYLIEELHSPRYGEYYIYFSNSVSRADIKRMADADDHEVVKEVSYRP